VAMEIARDIRETMSLVVAARSTLVIDPFAGSANTLYWILRNLSGPVGVGFELDPQVYQFTRQNLSILGLPIEFVHADYVNELGGLNVRDDVFLIVFIAPPWGTAFSELNGLDLRRTKPPVQEVVDSIALRFPNRVLFAIQVCERLVQDSLTEITMRFDWSTLHIYDSNKAGQNRNGLLLGTRGWRPCR
jgi:hypothetical protein